MSASRFFLNKRLICTALVCCWLAACATAPKQTFTRKDWQQRHRDISEMRNWEFAAAFSLRQANHSSIGNLSWQQQAFNYQLRIHGPLNIGTILINGNPKWVTLKTSRENISARNPDQLLLKATGWRLPISNLRYWVRGIPAPGPVQQQRFDQYLHLQSLTQQGWQIQYAQYRHVQGAIDLPTKITMSQPNIAIRIVIRSWKTHA